VESVELTVYEAKPRDVGRHRARINVDVMKKLNVNTGDIIEIKGRRRTAAIVWPLDPEDMIDRPNAIRMDDIVRKNAGVNIGETVVIKKANARSASLVKLAPTSSFTITVDPGFVNYVKRRLIDCPLVEGDTVLIPVLGQTISLKVILTIPYGIVVVNPNTNIVISEKPQKTAKEDIKITISQVLTNQGYEIIHVDLMDDEADIIAEKEGKQLIVKIVKDYVEKEKPLNFYITLGKLLTLVRNDDTEYAIVLTEDYEEQAKMIPEHVCQKLNMRIFMLKRRYTIEELK